jgi:hypothetical protein
MLAGELRNKIDAIWNGFWSGGLSNPLQMIEQIISKLDALLASLQHRAFSGADRRPSDRILQRIGILAAGSIDGSTSVSDFRVPERDEADARSALSAVV